MSRTVGTVAHMRSQQPLQLVLCLGQVPPFRKITQRPHLGRDVSGPQKNFLSKAFLERRHVLCRMLRTQMSSRPGLSPGILSDW